MNGFPVFALLRAFFPAPLRTTALLSGIFFLISTPASFSVPLYGAEIEKVSFADSARAGNKPLSLSGLGLLRYKRFIKAFVAGLYLEPGTPPASALQDIPKRLELHYFWNIMGPDFGKRADKILAATFPAATLDPLRGRIRQLHAAYRNVKAGDRYSLTYVPGTGTELALNNQPVITIPGADFAAAYFAIWLGEKSGSPELQKQLMTPVKGKS